MVDELESTATTMDMAYQLVTGAGEVASAHVEEGIEIATPEEPQATCSLDCKSTGLEEREKFHAVLDFYQKALEDLRTFASKKSFDKQFDGDKLFEKLEAKVVSPDFLERLGSIHGTPVQAAANTQDVQGSWDVITETDLDLIDSRNCLEPESYVVVNQDDIVEGMACFMARYVASLPQTKEMTPKQLQNALRKAFGVRNKGRLRRLWSSSKALYTAASWGATAVSLYNNPALVHAASNVFWTSIQLVTKYV